MKPIIAILLLVIAVALSLRYSSKHKIREDMIEFTAPQLSSDRDKDSMAELMRLGSQGQENAKYDTVDTRYLQ